jgi:hypothetical protein
MDEPTAHWFTSSFSSGSGNGCIEVAFLTDGTVGVRDTKDRTRIALSISSTAWTGFLRATRAGTFNLY